MSGIMSMLLGAVSSAAAAVDEFFNRVTLLLPGNGTNGAQNNTFLDSSTNNFSITRNGNTTQGTFSPFSQTGWSNHFNGATTSGPFISASYSTTNFDWFTSGQDFTLECWVFPADLATFSYSDGTNIIPRLTGNADVGGTINYWSFGPISDGKVRLHYFNGATVQVTSTSTVTANTWNHIAFTKTSSGIIIFVNGTATTATAVSGTPQSSASYPLVIGRINNASINGYVSNYRILKNVTPPYSGSYTVPTLPLTDISGTKILTMQANRFVDSSSVANAMTVTGSTVSVQAFSPFAPTAAYSAATVGGSGYFDGTGDYLAPTANLPAISTGQAFTLEMWVYAPAAVVNTNGAGLFGGISNAINFVIGVPSTNNITYGKFGVSNIINPGGACSITPGSWNHLVLCRNTSNQTAIFVDGTRVGSEANDTNSFVAATYNIANNNGNFINAYISSLRFVVGTAVYNPALTTLTVPTAPLTNITNTSLLLNFTNAGITDATAKNDLETVGNAQISTTQSKFGGSSMYFDGTGDSLDINNTQLGIFSSGDFTIECWIYFNALPGSGTNSQIIDFRGFGVGTNVAPCLSLNNTSGTYNIRFESGSSVIADRSVSVSTGTWYHLAAVRSSGNVSIYWNGTISGTAFSLTTNYSTGYPVRIGAYTSSVSVLNGYIDDLRVTRGYARYTANFTAPTTAFPLQ